MPSAQRPDDVERTEREGTEGHLHAARQHGVRPAAPDQVHRLTERHRPRRAGVGGRQDRSVDAQRDAQVGGRRAPEHRQREIGGHGPDAPVEEPDVLILGIGDATQGRADVDAGAIGPGVTTGPGVRAASAMASRPAASENWLNRSRLRAVAGSMAVSGSKSSTCAATLRPERRWVEAVDGPDGGPAGLEARPEGVPPDADGCHQPDARDPDAPLRSLTGAAASATAAEATQGPIRRPCALAGSARSRKSAGSATRWVG